MHARFALAAVVAIVVAGTAVASATAQPPPPNAENDRAGESLSKCQRDELLSRLRSTDETTRRTALEELARENVDAEFALPALREALEKPPTWETVLVVRVLAGMEEGAAPAASRLHDLLKATVLTGEESADANGKPELDGFLASELRVYSAFAMSRMGPAGEVALPTLIAMLRDPGPSLKRYRVARERRRFSPSAEGYAAMFLRKDDRGYYSDDRDSLIVATLGGLASFGPKASEALPEIRAIRDSPDSLSLVVEASKHAIEMIEESDESESAAEPSSPN